MNFGNLLTEIPEVQKIDTMLQNYQKDLVTKGQLMVKGLQDKYEAYQKEAADGKLSAIEQQKREQELQSENDNISQYEKEVQDSIAQKRNEWLQPVLAKVETAIKEVGKENGYTYIFDSSIPNAVLYAEDKDDVMALVKKKLGLK